MRSDCASKLDQAGELGKIAPQGSAGTGGVLEEQRAGVRLCQDLADRLTDGAHA